MSQGFKWSNGLVVRVLDSQSKGLEFNTTGWLQGQLSLSSLRGQLSEFQELLGTEWLKGNSPRSGSVALRQSNPIHKKGP